MILTAWALAGVAGPTIYDIVKEKTGSLDTTLMIFSGLFVVALVFSLLMKNSIAKSQKTANIELALT